MNPSKERPSFSDLNAIIERYLNRPETGDGGDLHFYKIIQHAIVASATDARQKQVPYKLHWPMGLQRLRYRLKALLGPKPPKLTLAPIVIVDDARRAIDDQGQEQSYYFGSTLKLLKREQRRYTFLPRARSEASDLHALTYADLLSYGAAALTPEEVQVLRQTKKVAQQCEHFDLPGFRDYLFSALQVFFESFHVYYQLFNGQGVKKLILTDHYHSEGLIFAARMHGIEVIEYQHGLISEKDIYYCYPEVISKVAHKAAFADTILVFGPFWKNVLLEGHEYRDDQIIVAGDYSFSGTHPIASDAKASDANTSRKENMVLIGSQKTMADEYLPYLNRLMELVEAKHPDWKVVVKLHPFEAEAHKYRYLKAHPQCEVVLNEESLSALLMRTKIQISIYSTTFFDALGFDVINYALQNYTASHDYAASMVKSGVALPLAFDEDPIERYLQVDHTHKMPSRSAVYAPLDQAQLLARIVE